MERLDECLDWLDQVAAPCHDKHGRATKIGKIGQGLLLEVQRSKPLRNVASFPRYQVGGEDGEEVSGPSVSKAELKSMQKTQRKWHVRLNEVAAKSGEELVLFYVGNLVRLTLLQMSGDQVEENLNLYVDTVSRLLSKMDSSLTGLIIAGQALVETVHVKMIHSTNSASWNNELKTQLGKLVLDYGKSLRTVLQGTEERMLWGSTAQNESIARCLDVLESIIDMVPHLARSSANQIEHICVPLILGACGEQLQAASARLLAKIPSTFAGQMGNAWNGLIGASLQAGWKLLKASKELKTISTKKVNAKEMAAPSSLVNGNYFTVLASCDEIVKSARPTTNQVVNDVMYGLALKGICETICMAFSGTQSKGAYLEIGVKPLLQFIERGLTVSTTKLDQHHSASLLRIQGSLQVLVAVTGVAKLKILRFRSRWTHAVENLFTLPYPIFSGKLDVLLAQTCQRLAAILGNSFPDRLFNMVVDRTIYLLKFIQQSYQTDWDAMLEVSKQNVKGNASKRRRVARQMVTNASPQPRKRQEDYDACTEMLRCVTMLLSLSLSSTSVSRERRDVLDAAITKLLLPIISGYPFILDQVSPIAIDRDLRYSLLKTLLASVMAPIERNDSSKAIPVALEIFSVSQHNETDPEIVQFSKMAMASMLPIVQPSRPIIGAPSYMQLAKPESRHQNVVEESEEDEPKQLPPQQEQREHEHEEEQENDENQEQEQNTMEVEEKQVAATNEKEAEVEKEEARSVPAKATPQTKPSARNAKASSAKRKRAPSSDDDDDDSDIPSIVD